jgi:dihydropyrimidinase
VIDYSLHPIITELTNETMLEVPKLIDMGLASFKVYTTYESRLESPDIQKFVRLAGEAGGLPGFHAEHHGLLTEALKDTKNSKSVAINDFPHSRPAKAEVASIREVSRYAKEVGCPVYIYHVSGSDALAEIELSRSEGVDVRAETCAHYLVYEDSVYGRDDGWKYVITPPIRSHNDREELWRAVARGRLEGVASDHCAYSLANKAAGLSDFTAMEPGAPGIASRMPLLWHYGVTQGRISPREFVDINSRRPAAALGLQQKGKIAVGADADIAIWDPSLEWTWDSQSEELSNGSDYDIYHGLAGRGAPRTTLSRGRIVHGEGAATSSGGGSLISQTISV